jgi:hypothetical protein
MLAESDTADHDRPDLPLGICGWAISGACCLFAVWGWTDRAGLLSSSDVLHTLRNGGAGFAFYAALSVIMQATGNVAAQAVRRAGKFSLHKSRPWAIGVVGAGLVCTAYSIHNAFERSGLVSADAALGPQAVAVAVSIAIAFSEVTVWWLDEALKAEAAARRARDIRDIQEQGSGRRRNSLSVTPLDIQAMSDEALAALITSAASAKKQAENERTSRTKLIKKNSN